MLDVLMPLCAANQGLVPDCILSISKNTEFSFRLIIIVDGGTRNDLHDLESFLGSYEGNWKLLHNQEPVYLNQTIREGLEECTAKLTAVIAPQVRIEDPRWWTKVQQIFHRDPAAFIVDTTPNTKSTTLHPVKRSHTHPASAGCRFAVVKTEFAKSKLPYGDVDPVAAWSRAANALGGSTWAAPGVRYFLTECQEHELWRAPLASKE